MKPEPPLPSGTPRDWLSMWTGHFNRLLVLYCIGVSGCQIALDTHGTLEEFVIPAKDESAERITTVLEEMDGNYGGTLVCDPEDPAIDSPAFVERYLRRFGDPQDLSSYDYRFERLLSRTHSHQKALKDQRLDLPVWEAYQKFQLKHPNRWGYKRWNQWNTIHTLDSARDLLWMYLEINAPDIRTDESRRKFWIDKLLVHEDKSDQLFRQLAVLMMISYADEKPTSLTVVELSEDLQLPAGVKGLEWFANKVSLKLVTWGFDPTELPAPRVRPIPSGRWEYQYGVDQESWSHEATGYQMANGFFSSISLLPRERKSDGIHFSEFEGELHVWKKSNFLAGILRMLQVSRFLDEKEFQHYAIQLRLEPLLESYRTPE